MRSRIGFVVACWSIALLIAVGPTMQAQKVDDYPASQLMLDARNLLGKGDPVTGISERKLEQYPNHYTLLIVRTKDGQSELHEHMADVLIVLDGDATLWTGGHMTDAKPTGKGEARGTGVDGGTATTLGKGDIVHIPANVPHQIRLAPKKTITYFVVKVAEDK